MKKCQTCNGTGVMTVECYSDGSERRTTCVACGGSGERELRSDPTQPDPEEMTPEELELTARYAVWMKKVLSD